MIVAQIIVGLLIIGGAVYGFWRQMFTVVLVEEKGELISVRRWRIRRQALLILGSGIFFGYGVMGLRLVPPGEIAVRPNGSPVEGIYWTAWPLEPVRAFPTGIQVLQLPQGEGEDRGIWGRTQDGVSVGLRLEVWYQADRSRIETIARRWIHPDAIQAALVGLVEGEVRDLLVTITVRDLHTRPRDSLAHRLEERLRKAVEKEGVLIERVVLRDILIPVSFQKAFEKEALVRAQLAQEDLEVERAKKQAERSRIEAEARARAIEIVSQALRKNPEYIRYLYVDKLSDQVEVIVQDVPGFLSFPKNQKGRTLQKMDQ